MPHIAAPQALPQGAFRLCAPSLSPQGLRVPAAKWVPAAARPMPVPLPLGGWRGGLTFPAPCAAVRLGWRGVPSGTVTFQPTSPRKFRACDQKWPSVGLAQITTFVGPAHQPRSRPTAGERPSSAGWLEGVDRARRSAGQWSPICSQSPFSPPPSLPPRQMVFTCPDRIKEGCTPSFHVPTHYYTHPISPTTPGQGPARPFPPTSLF